MKRIHGAIALALMFVCVACNLGTVIKYEMLFLIKAENTQDRDEAIEVIKQRLVLLGADKEAIGHVDADHISIVEIRGDSIPLQEMEKMLSFSARDSYLVPVEEAGLLQFMRLDSLLSSIIIREGGLNLVSAADTAIVNQKFKAYAAATGRAEDDLLWTESPNARIEKSVGTYYEVYLGKQEASKVPLTVQTVEDASITVDGSGRLAISIHLHEAWINDWAKMTREQIGGKVAIVFDGKVLSAPTVMSEIKEGELMISGYFEIAELERIRVSISSPPLPAGTSVQAKVGYH